MLSSEGKPPSAAEFYAFQHRRYLAAMAQAAQRRQPEPFPGCMRLLTFQCAAAVREIGQAKRAEWMAEGREGLRQLVEAHPELMGS